MSLTYTKLFTSITDSTVWAEPSDIRIVWITLLAMADRSGNVYASIPGLAHRARVSLENTQAALKKFMEPDPFSRSPEFEGRRIAGIQGGWHLLNHEKYRDLRNDEAIKESKRRWAANHRAEEYDAKLLDAQIPSVDEVIKYGGNINCPEDVCRKFHKWHWENRRWLNSVGVMIDWKKKLVGWRETEKTRPALPKVGDAGAVHPVANRIAIEKTIKILEGQIMESPANPESVFFNSERTDLEKAALKELRRKKAALEQQLASLVTQGV